jgi:hypothetical protein
MPRRLLTVSVLCAGLALAGCGTSTGEPGAPGTSATPTTLAPTTSRTKPPTAPVTPPPAKDQVSLTMTGTVARAEVEGGCLVLEAARGRYQLAGEVDGLRPGLTATVLGHVDDGLMSTCQVGPILVVERVVRTSG